VRVIVIGDCSSGIIIRCSHFAVSEFNRKKALLYEKLATDLNSLVESTHAKALSLKAEFGCLPDGSTVAGLWTAMKA
jgi:hypothetical protein